MSALKFWRIKQGAGRAETWPPETHTHTHYTHTNTHTQYQLVEEVYHGEADSAGVARKRTKSGGIESF